MAEFFRIDGNNLRVLRPPDLANAALMTQLSQAFQSMLDAAPERIVIDFTDAAVLSSSIIGITLLAVQLAASTKIAVTVHAPMRHHQALVAAGLTRLADLRLCG